jgi:cyclophilin family peptidyl-prolyl cis-trans isomerase
MPASMKRWIRCGIGAVAATLVGLAGCKKGGDEGDKNDIPKPPVQVEAKKDNNGKTLLAQSVALEKAPQLLSFKDAVILDPHPEGESRPPNKTHTGKNAVKIFELIANDLWDKVNFTDNGGRRIKYRAIVATELGDIHIALHGNIAPNHVRSFVCLAKTGYYDGMAFYYSINRKVVDDTVAYIEAGCPRGTGEIGSGSIGYWLRPEISDKLTHEEGVLGACIGRDPESAACRFYLTAAAMPQMDGEFTIFGKVTQGLDVVRTINKRAVQENDRLEQPVLLRSVTIQTEIE